MPFPEPTAPAGSRTEVFLRYLDYFRSRLAAKLETLTTPDLRRSSLPSGWTPLELLKHLRYVELRWLEWGFEGRDVADPWGDQRDGRWHVSPEDTLPSLLADLRDQAARTRAIVESHDLAEVGQPGERWDGADPATLERILFHLLQEYARHVGHLDIVVELATDQAGELFSAERAVVRAHRFSVGSSTALSPTGMNSGSPNLTICRTAYSPALGSVNSVQLRSTGSISKKTGTPPRA